MLQQRLEVAEGENHEDLESKLKEMNHLLELEKLERANIEAELGAIKQQRDTWNAYFERRNEEEGTMEVETVEAGHVIPTNIRKSPRKSMSSVDQKEYIRLVGVEANFKDFKARTEDDMKDLKVSALSFVNN